MLAAMVQSGELPPVTERLPDDPLVLEPYGQTGVYGGELRAARTGPSDWGDMHRGRKAFLFRADPTLNEAIPYAAKGWEMSDDQTVLTFHLREGMKWSDGEPFTTADFMWIYDNVFLNYDIPTSSRNSFTMGGELADWEAVDDYTLVVTFPAPITLNDRTKLLNWSQVQSGRLFAPAHHMRQFHPDVQPRRREARQGGRPRHLDRRPAGAHVRFAFPEAPAPGAGAVGPGAARLDRHLLYPQPLLLRGGWRRQSAPLHRPREGVVLRRQAGGDPRHDAGQGGHRRAPDRSGQLPAVQGERGNRQLPRTGVAGHQGLARHVRVQREPPGPGEERDLRRQAVSAGDVAGDEPRRDQRFRVPGHGDAAAVHRGCRRRVLQPRLGARLRRLRPGAGDGAAR